VSMSLFAVSFAQHGTGKGGSQETDEGV
jgi:hypothetical protein